jgi:hypothetical protein
MDIKLDSDFCLDEAPWMQWRDIKYGVEHGFLSPHGAVKYAVKNLTLDSSVEHYELAGLAGNEVNEVMRHINNLAAEFPKDAEETEKVWIFLIFCGYIEIKIHMRTPWRSLRSCTQILAIQSLFHPLFDICRRLMLPLKGMSGSLKTGPKFWTCLERNFRSSKNKASDCTFASEILV